MSTKKKTQPSDVVQRIHRMFIEDRVRAYYKHAIKRVFIESPEKTACDLARTYADLKGWEPGPVRKVNGTTWYFSVPVEQVPHGNGGEEHA